MASGVPLARQSVTTRWTSSKRSDAALSVWMSIAALACPDIPQPAFALLDRAPVQRWSDENHGAHLRTKQMFAELHAAGQVILTDNRNIRRGRLEHFLKHDNRLTQALQIGQMIAPERSWGRTGSRRAPRCPTWREWWHR